VVITSHPSKGPLGAGKRLYIVPKRLSRHRMKRDERDSGEEDREEGAAP
jgi:hypothetical protein